MILVAAVAGAAWLMFRSRKKGGQGWFGRRIGTQSASSASGAVARRTDQKSESSMPRLGVPRTVTGEQLRRLERLNFPRDRNWSREEADLILDSVIYLRAVCGEAIRQPEPPLPVQNALLRTILTDQDLRDYVRAWGERRRDNGEADTEPVLAHNNQFERVAAAARELTGQS